MRRILLVLTTLMVVCLCGCFALIDDVNSGGYNNDNNIELGFVVDVVQINVDDEDYYSQVAELNNIENSPSALKYKEEWEEKYGKVRPALAWKLERSERNPEAKWHVIMTLAEGESGSEEEIKKQIEEKVKSINEQCGSNIDTTKWTDVLLGYYCVVTEEELFILTNNGFYASLVGSGESDYRKMDLNTEEGADIFVELYGDGYVQYIDGKEIKDYTK